MVALGILYGAWYLISPIFIEKELNEPSPIATEDYEPNNVVTTEVTVFDPNEGEAMEKKEDGEKMMKEESGSMSDEKMSEFKAEMEKMEGEVMEKAEAMPEGPKVTAQGAFNPDQYDVAGKALLIESADKKIIRFEDFETINGPNLHIYLATDTSGDDYVDLGEIKATKGNVNYEIDPSIDTEKYDHVLVWCVPFKVLFSYAQLQ